MNAYTWFGLFVAASFVVWLAIMAGVGSGSAGGAHGGGHGHGGAHH